MELLYKVDPDLDGAEDYIVSNKRLKLTPQRKPLVSISVKNLIVFSSNVDLTTTSSRNRSSSLAKNRKRGANVANLSDEVTEDIAGYHVYVADLNVPWEIFLIKNTSSSITYLAWDHTGTKILLGTENGQVEIYSMVDQLLNKWKVSASMQFPGEPIISLTWLSPPRRLQIVPDKLEGMLYSEKYSGTIPFGGKGFGGKGLEGALAITATGLVGTISIIGYTVPPISCLEKLGVLRSQIIAGDVAYTHDGDFMVVTASESLRQPVLLYKVSAGLSPFRDKAEIKVSAAQSFFLNDLTDHSVTSVKFINSWNPDQLTVTLSNKYSGASSIYLYELLPHTITLKTRFQTNGGGNDVVNTLKWQQMHQVQFPSNVSALCVLSSPLLPPSSSHQQSPSAQTNPQQNQNATTLSTLTPSIAIALTSGSIVLIRADNLKEIGSIFLPSTSNSPVIPSEEQNQSQSGTESPLGPQAQKTDQLTTQNPSEFSLLVSSLCFSWSGSVLISLTSNAHLHAWKVNPNLDASTASILLELGMIGGHDGWDVMMCIRPPLIDNVTDRLSETFARQPPPVQSHYNAKILVVKASLYRMASSGAARINDQQTLLILYLVSGALKALLRPAELSSREKGPAESLSSLLSSSGESYADLTKVLVQMAATEYAVEAPTLQSIQQFLQWVADLALKLLSTLPDLRHSRAPGWEVCRDSKAVSTLRELIVLMRIWGLQRPSCLPAFRKTSESLDVLPLLFRLLTRLSVAPHDPDEALIDECCLLPSEVQIPNHTAYCPTKSLGVASSIIFSKGNPHQFEFGNLPLKWWVGMEMNGNWMDGLRLLWLGKNPSGVKICNRCGLTTLIHLPPRSTANKAWDQRWMKNCPCGGSWKIPSFLPQTKLTDADFLNHL